MNPTPYTFEIYLIISPCASVIFFSSFQVPNSHKFIDLSWDPVITNFDYLSQNTATACEWLFNDFIIFLYFIAQTFNDPSQDPDNNVYLL